MQKQAEFIFGSKIEQNEFKGGTIDEKIQTADRNVVCGVHIVYFAWGWNASRSVGRHVTAKFHADSIQ